MIITSKVGTLPDGARGIDVNRNISAKDAAAIAGHGYRFVVRYVRRHDPHAYDLNAQEVAEILAAGLGLMIVQHVAPEGWVPSQATGASFGGIAAAETAKIGIPLGVTVWCDLEGVRAGVPHADVIAYCNAWYDAVAAAGYTPGLYVGFACGLTAHELYNALRFRHYWSAYNLNADSIPEKRGVQMRQSAARASDLVPGFTNQTLDVDVIHADALGGTPFLLLPL